MKMEESLRAEILEARASSDTRNAATSEEFTVLRAQNDLLAQKLNELMEQKEVYTKLEEALRAEIFDARASSDTRNAAISEDVAELRTHNDFLSQKINELMEQNQTTNSQVSTNENLLNTRFNSISLQLMSQQRLLDKVAKFLGI